MIISPGRNFIFVHIPKTGGTSMALALEGRAKADDILIGDTPKAVKRRRRLKGVQTVGRLWKHSMLRDLPDLLTEPQMTEMFTFTLVRNPWDRIVSYYHWLQDQSFDHPAVTLAQTFEFSEFLRQPHTQNSFREVSSESYLTLPSGRLHCSCFLRLEHLSQDIAPVEEHLGFSIHPLPHSNSSKREKGYQQYYSAESKDLVSRLCAPDIARFGYSFD